ncbi:MAG: type II toxin-antitoxin system VapC family toxin [Nitrosomonadales bacterium]|nr:type II toxin-antitoxin system VapC family toxin [Nitrosomonadales bacterium]
MILVDTSVWIDHLRHGDVELTGLLNAGQVLTHRFVIGELALGNLQNRNTVLSAMQNLPQVTAASDEEALHFIESNALFGTGIGYIDAHLLAAVRLSPGALLWTRDKRLLAESMRLGLCVRFTH